ncbi:MAG: amino acid permease [Proteobacteria bacterium]|nr:amino acid permease [Pseudomonadota bacterium]
MAVVSISISAMLGSGIFVLPGLAAAKTGPSVWLAYVLAGICVLPAALSKAELATAMPTSGGTYVYLDRTFGPLVGTISGLGLWISLLLKSAFALVGFSAYLVVLADVPLEPTALILLACIVTLNLRGVRKVSQVQVVVVAVSITGLLGLSVAGIFQFDSSHFDRSFVAGPGGLTAAVAFVFVSYAGVTKVAAIAEEVKQPDRNLPLGMLLSLSIATALYGGITLVMVGAIPFDVFYADLHPVYSLANQLDAGSSIVHAVGIMAAVLGVVTMTSMANAGLLAASRFPFAMSRAHLLPARLSQLHSRFLTPTACIWLSGAIMAAAIVLFDIERIAKLASAVIIMLFIAVNLAVMVLRETRVQWYQPGFRSPLYPWIQIFGVLSGLVLLAVMGALAFVAAVALSVPGALLYAGYGRHRAGRRGVFSQRRPRRDLLTGPADDSMAAVLSGDSNGKDIDDHDSVASGLDSGLFARKAPVAVALFGTERSPEMLVELGEALSEDDRLQVVHITEVPEQTALEGAIDDAVTSSLQRRVHAVAEMQNVTLGFDSIASRDVLETVNALTKQLDCSWLIMAWSGRTKWAFTVYNPIGWLSDHLSCNLATFHDAGVRYLRKILVRVEPGPHDALVMGTADHLAELNRAELTFVKFVADGAPAALRQSAGDYLDQVRQLSSAPAQTVLLRGKREDEAIAEMSVRYDLIITGGMPHGTLWQRIRGKLLDRITESAACSVLTVQTPQTSTHESFQKYQPRSPQKQPGLIEFIHPKCVEVGLEPMKKDALFVHIARTFAAALPDLTQEAVHASLWERERTQNTAMGHGIALPHATLEAAGRTHLGIFVATGPLDYESQDNQDIDVVFATLGTAGDRQTHLHLLSNIAKLCLQSNILDRLRTASTSDEALAALHTCCAEVADADTLA